MKKVTGSLAMGAVSVLLSMGCGQSQNESRPALQQGAIQSYSYPSRPSGGEFSRARDQYGPLRISEGSLFSDTGVEPWSGFWYPYSESLLFEGKEQSSPLEKYDQYNEKAGQKSLAAQFERTHFYQPQAEGWAGRCDAWAIASLSAKEPPALKEPVLIDGIPFTTSDLKALLVLSYENVEGLTQFGQRFDGDYRGVPEDIYPDEFHLVIQKEIFERKKPVIIDKDPGIQVWNTPVFKANTEIIKDRLNPRIYHVKTTLVGLNPDSTANPAENPRRPVLFEYTYDLWGEPTLDGGLKVEYGEWTRNSIKTHPDFVWILPDSLQHESLNREVRNDRVEEILNKVRSLISVEPS